MAEKKIFGRAIQKHDVESNWLKATNFIPLKGEIIVYDIDTTYNYERLKIGDGQTVVSSLPFVDDAVKTIANSKVDKVTGKGLSTNDYTTTEKNKLAGIATGANKTVVDSSLSSTSTNPVQNKVVNTAISAINTLVGDTSVSEQISTAIAESAYSLPAAGTALGGVKSGGDVTISSGVITVNDDSHNHTISNVDGLQTALDGKADSNHSHSSYVNQNAFSNVVVGSTTIAADSVTDTLTLVAGSNVTITPDATNDKVTIAAKDTVYTHPNSGVTAGTYKSVTVNAAGHVTAGSNPTTLSGYGITDAATKASVNNLSALVGDTAVSEQISSAVDGCITGLSVSGKTVTYTKGDGSTGTITTQDTNTTYNAATQSAQGLMSAADKKKLDGIASGANAYSHPTTTGNKHIPSGGSSGQILRWSADGTAVWGADNNTTYSVATTSANGLMSSTDKSKLDGIADGANKTTVDSSLSTTSTNPVQNKIIAAQINNLNALVGDTSVAEQIAAATGGTADAAYVNYGVVTTGDGSAYTATVPGIDSLAIGVSFVMVPHVVSASSSPTLNVNGLGAKQIRRRLSSLSTAAQTGYTTTWLAANKPFRVTYDGTQWIVDGLTKPAAADLYGTLSITKGGTGATTVAEALTNLGIIVSDTEPASPTTGMLWFDIS